METPRDRGRLPGSRRGRRCNEIFQSLRTPFSAAFRGIGTQIPTVEIIKCPRRMVTVNKQFSSTWKPAVPVTTTQLPARIRREPSPPARVPAERGRSPPGPQVWRSHGRLGAGSVRTSADVDLSKKGLSACLYRTTFRLYARAHVSVCAHACADTHVFFPDRGTESDWGGEPRR